MLNQRFKDTRTKVRVTFVTSTPADDIVSALSKANYYMPGMDGHIDTVDITEVTRYRLEAEHITFRRESRRAERHIDNGQNFYPADPRD